MFCNFHTHSRNTGELALVSQTQPDGLGFSSLEFHPWHLPETFSGLPEKLPAELSRCAALGEIGLDRLRGPALAVQLLWFRTLLDLAAETGKPVVLHIVRARNEAFAELARFPGKVLWHGFRGKGSVLAELLARGYYVSLAPGSWHDPQIAGILQKHTGRIGFETDDRTDCTIAELLADAGNVSKCRNLESWTEENFREFLS